MKKESKNANAERRVYLLPNTLLAKVRAYQAKNKISSEVEAVRRLLGEALQTHDSIEDILYQCREKYKENRNLRDIAADILSFHHSVSKIEFIEDGLKFYMKSGEVALLSEDYVRDEWESREYNASTMQYIVPQMQLEGIAWGASLIGDDEFSMEKPLPELENFMNLTPEEKPKFV